MTKSIEIDEELLSTFIGTSEDASARSAVEDGMRELIALRNQRAINSHFGTVDFFPDYDYKQMRQDEHHR